MKDKTKKEENKKTVFVQDLDPCLGCEHKITPLKRQCLDLGNKANIKRCKICIVTYETPTNFEREK